ncbi:diacylglycerol kinase family protein [Flavitalea flava]
MKQQKFSINSRAKSFTYAGAGIVQFLRMEHNAWIHLAATILVAIAAWFFKVTGLEAIALVFAVGLVWVTEMLNTCLEKMADLITAEERPEIKFIKDLAAGAVLVAAITSVIIGLIIFIPRMAEFLSKLR